MLLLMQNLKANKSFLKLDFYKLEKKRVIGKLHKSTSILAAKFQKEESPYCSVPIFKQAVHRYSCTDPRYLFALFMT